MTRRRAGDGSSRQSLVGVAACVKWVALVVVTTPTRGIVAQLSPLDVTNALVGQAVWVSGGVRGTNATCGLVQGDTTCDLEPDLQATTGVACGAAEACGSLDCSNIPFRPTPTRVLEVATPAIIGDTIVDSAAGRATFPGRGRLEAALPAESGPLQHFGFSAWLRADPGLPQR